MSEEEENEFLEEGFNLDSPEADRVVNFGTSAPNCQPKHTQDLEEFEDIDDDEGEGGDTQSGPLSEDGKGSLKHRRDSSMSDDDQRKRQHLAQQQQPKKLSYIQMAKLGYQELVNAIIRPPRADYKVSTDCDQMLPF